MDYTRLLNALPQAKAAYGDGSNNGPTSVGSWNVTPVTKFEPETSNFQAGFYKDSTSGLYRVGFAGSNDSQDWTRANANLATGDWTPEATDSIRFVGAALVQIRDEMRLIDPSANPTLPELMSKLDTTVGHSQGGAWAELNRAFWGGNAVNIDGPGVGALLNKPEFAALKAEMQKEFPDLASEAFTANDGSMQSYAFSKIGLTGDHVGAEVQATADAKVVDFITDFPLPPLMGQQAAIGSLHTALTHRIDAIENQAKEGALAEMNSQITDAFSQADQTAADIKAQYPNTVQVADASGDLPNTSAQTNTNTLTNYLNTQGSALSAAQQTALATQIDSLGLGGEGDLSFYTLPNGSVLIANADGDIVGEINHSQSGGLNLSATGLDANGNTVEVNNHIGESGDVQTQVQYNAQVQAQANASVNLFNSLMAAQQWNQLDDMGKLSVLVNVYSAADTLGGNLPGDLGGLASVLSLMQGLESGNDLLVLRSSLQLGAMGLDAYSDYMSDLALQMADDLMASATVDAASSAAMDVAAEAALESAAASNAAGSAVPYVSYVMALQNFEDHPEQSAGTVIGTYIGQSIGYSIGGPIGAAIGGAIGGLIGGTIGGMFGDDDIPMREGLAHAQWDESGHTQVVTTQDAEGGGATANAWMAGLVNGLQDNLDQHTDANGQPQYGLVPNLLPSVGFKYDPDGFNLANGASGFMYLEWTDESGQTQTRYYDGAGNRGDGSGETLAGDFMQHALDAIAPAWQVQTALAHYQQSGQIELPAQTQNLPAQLEDGLHQTVQVLTLELGSALPTEVAPNSRWIDVDADGYLEQTQWAQANQAMLAVDLNGDGQIGLPLNLNATNLDKQAANDKFFRSAA